MDYEHQNFSISQRLSKASIKPKIVPILSTSHYSAPAGLDQSSEIGIAVGVVVGCLLVASGLVIWNWKRQKRGGREDIAPVQEPQTPEEFKDGDNMTELSCPVLLCGRLRVPLQYDHMSLTGSPLWKWMTGK